MFQPLVSNQKSPYWHHHKRMKIVSSMLFSFLEIAATVIHKKI
ncbi:MAG TPA: hypothetical protein DEB17_05805 [Chlorobaculum sp.]|uniref:Uncharacterized protein n=1 Tax=Chlorobaculum tepidum (strain ATCC 49652 / DSM 12025 / NBRC 103806 / TLS) TaxID=194439 RepID=Q8KF35_CHLTE|nr:hypothetical protein CT0497 [Chlorobaculum tepidum TLS]HBU23500.1 hypothetical protein [Chlorobaculum sp.]